MTKNQRRELKGLLKFATKLGVRENYTLQKIFKCHTRNNWDWKVSNQELRKHLISLSTLFTTQDYDLDILPEASNEFCPNLEERGLEYRSE